MKRNNLCVLLSSLILLSLGPGLFGQINLEWKTSIDIGNDAGSSDLALTNDGGYIAMGTQYVSDSPIVWLIKLDIDGNSEWSNSYSGGGYWDGRAVLQTSDEGFILGGGYDDMWLIKTDSQGDTLWTRSYSGGCSDIEQTSDGGYIIIGARLLKLNATGDSIWSNSTVSGNAIQQTNDGGYILVGEVWKDENGYIIDTPSHENDHMDIRLIKTDSDGDTLWTRIYGGDGYESYDCGNHIQQTEDGGYIVAAGLDWNHMDFHKGYCIKIDSIGNTQWTYVDPLFSSDIIYQLEDGGFLILGTPKEQNGSHLTKIDKRGNELWTEIFEPEMECGYNHGRLTNDGGLILLGWFDVHLWIAKIGSICSAQEPKWTQLTDMQDVRQGHASGVLDELIYVLGGVPGNTPETHYNARKSMEFYDPDLDIWTPKADMNTGRVQFPTCVFDGKIYAFGGGQSVYWDPLKSIEVYDPISDTWTTLEAELPIARMQHSATLVNGKIYIIGGTDSNDETALSEVNVYDPLTNTWDPDKAILPTPRQNLKAVELNGKIYTIGGHLGPQDDYLPLTTVEAYDPANDTWTTKADMSRPRFFFAVCVLNEKIYVFGGAKNCDNAWSSVEVYDPESDTWTEGASMSEPWVMAAAAPFNGKIYLSGGTFQICPPSTLSVMYEYDPDPKVNVPDTAFLYALIEEGVDTNGDSLISYAEAEMIASLDVGGTYDTPGNITDLTGIEAFIHLDSLFCNNNSIETLNISGLSKLVNVHCEANQLNSLDVSKNTALRELFCGANPFTSIDLSACTALETLDCHGTQLTNLDISNNTSLTSISLGCSDLHEVCVWTLPFPPEGVYVDDHYNDSICYETDCNGVCEYDPSGITKCDQTGWSIYPNPTNTLLTIETEQAGYHSFEIASLNGQLIFSGEMEGSSHQIDLSSLRKGVYFITIRSADVVTTRKIIKL